MTALLSKEEFIAKKRDELKRATIVLMFKSTYACNASCSYCHLYKLGSKFPQMSIETLQKSIKRLEEYILELNPKEKVTVKFIWHGGEPMLLDDSFYKKAEKIIKSSYILNTRANYYHTTQTNFTLYHKKDMPNFYSLLKGKIFGVSYDPLTDERVLNNKSIDYKSEFLKSYFKLKKDGGKAFLLYVVTKESVKEAKKLYYFFKNMNFDAVEVNPVYGVEDTMTPDEYGKFLCELWDIWIQDDKSVKLTIFDRWESIYKRSFSKYGVCHYGDNCIKHVFMINPNGDILGCGKHSEKPFGTIYKNSFLEVEYEKSKVVDKRNEFLLSQESECKGCKWWSYCHGDCPFSTEESSLFTTQKSLWCQSYKMLFEKVF